MTQIDSTLMQRKILITCGTGGVGKTTLSAALALRAATLGKKAAVVTIDPAKRLSQSLGIQTLGNHPTDLTPEIQAAYRRSLQTPRPFSEPRGTLAAIMPDTRRTFEDFVAELAPNPQTQSRILQNPIFKIFAKEFSGTNEYMALERLLALYKNGQYDCIILDTPPSRNTLSFLDAPRILSSFFDESVIKWLLVPTHNLISFGMKKSLGILERLTGAGFMTHLFEFAAALFEVQNKFNSSLKKITSLLESSEVGFLMVTTPHSTTHSDSEIRHFLSTLQKYRFHFDGMILNRTLNYLKSTTADPSLASGYAVIHELQAKEDRILKKLLENQFPICAKVPELARDVHSVEDLFHVAMALGIDPSL